jgi:hypothetical protein
VSSLDADLEYQGLPKTEPTPWHVFSLIAPGLELAAVSRFMWLPEERWQLVSGLWEQEVEDGLWRVDLHDCLLLFSPLYEDVWAAPAPPSERRMPPRRVELSFVPDYLERAGLEIEWLLVRGASGWVMNPDPSQWDGFLAARGEVTAPDTSWGRRRIPFEVRAHGEVLGPDRPSAIRLAEIVLGLRR